MNRISYLVASPRLPVGSKSIEEIILYFLSNISNYRLDCRRSCMSPVLVVNSRLYVKKEQDLIFGNGGGDCSGLVWPVSGVFIPFLCTGGGRYVIQAGQGCVMIVPRWKDIRDGGFGRD